MPLPQQPPTIPIDGRGAAAPFPHEAGADEHELELVVPGLKIGAGAPGLCQPVIEAEAEPADLQLQGVAEKAEDT
jgi:hypothetical protein